MTTFRVLQWNMQFAQGWDDARPDDQPVNLGAVIAEIRRHRADIIILQEVERALSHGAQAEPPPNYTALKSALGYDGWFSYPKADPRELPFGIGLAIFSRTPLTELFRLDLPSPPIEFDFYGEKTTPTDRLLIGAKTMAGGREIQILNTHLLAFFMLRTSSVQHPEQREIISRHLAGAQGPTLLGGDFNARHHETLVSQFAGSGFATVQVAETTWRRRPYVLDHIFYNPPLQVVDHTVVPTHASDHHVLVADFEFAD